MYVKNEELINNLSNRDKVLLSSSSWLSSSPLWLFAVLVQPPFCIHIHICTPFAFSGSNGMDVVLSTSTVQGGEGGILINGSGPFGEAGGGNISAAGGVGYGAGGGAGGAVYLDSHGPLIYSGGRGADGMVYVEMVDSGAFHGISNHSVPVKLPIKILVSVLASSENNDSWKLERISKMAKANISFFDRYTFLVWPFSVVFFLSFFSFCLLACLFAHST